MNSIKILQNDCKMAENIDQIIKDFLAHFNDENAIVIHCTFIAMGLKIFGNCLKIDVV